MKRLNVKLVAVLSISLIVVSLGTYAVHGIQVRGNAKTLQKRGDEATALGKEAKAEDNIVDARDYYQQADRHYSRYLKLRKDKQDEDVREVRVSRANVVTDIAELPDRTGQDINTAIRVLEGTVSDHKDEHELRRRLADYLMGFHRFPDAIAHWNQLVAVLPKDADAKYKLALCYYRQNKNDIALENLSAIVGYDRQQKQFDRSAALASDMLDAYVLMARIIRIRPDAAALADRVMDAMIAANAQDHNAYLRRSSYRRLFPDGQETDVRIGQDINTARDLAPTDANVLLAAADLAQRGNQPDKYEVAGVLLERGKQLHPENDLFYHNLAWLHLTQNKPKEAKQEIEEGLKHVPDSPNLLLMLAQTQLQLGDKDGISRTKKKLETSRVRPEWIEFVDALSMFMDQNWFETSQAFERVRRFWTNDPAKLRDIDRRLAVCYDKLGQPDLQLVAIQRVLANRADLGAVFNLIKAHVALGRTDEARARLLAIRKNAPKVFYASHALWTMLLNLEKLHQLRRPEQQRDWSVVDEIMTAVNKQYQERAVKLTSDLAAAVQAGEAEKVTNLRKGQQMVAVVMAKMSAGVAEAKGDSDTAQALLDEARKRFPGNYQLQKLELSRIQRVDGPVAALARIAEMKLAFPVAELDLTLSEIDLIVVQNEKHTRARLAEIEASVDGHEPPYNPRHRQILWGALADAYHALRDYDETKRLMRLEAEVDSGNPRYLMQQFEIARAAGEVEWMREVVDDLKKRKIAGTGRSQLLYAEAALAVTKYRKSEEKDSKLLEEARKSVRQAKIVRPKWYRLSQLVGEINHIEKNVDEAIKGYSDALSQGPADIATVQRLVALLSSKRRYKEALTAIERLGDTRRNPLLQRAKAEIYQVTGDMPRALEAAARAVATDSTDSDDLRWYGRILANAGRLAEAEAIFRRAVEHGSDHSPPWLDLVRIQLAAKQPAKAEETIREAQLRLPEDISLPFMAKCYRLIGNQQLELQFHRDNVRRHPNSLPAMKGLAQYYRDRGDNVKSKEIVYRMILVDAPDTQSNVNDRRWARQLMAMMLSAKGQYREVNYGLKILEGNAIDGQLSADDRLLKARLLAQRPEPDSRGQAIKLFEELSRQDPTPLTSNDRLRMARLYERSDKWRVCQETMSALVNEHPESSAYLVGYIHMLLRNDEANQVTPQLARLRRIPNMQVMAIQLEAMMLAKLGRGGDAAAKIRAAVQKSRPLDARSYSVLTDAAKVMVQLKQYPAAEKLYREYVTKVPRGALVLANFLAVHGTTAKQVDEAFAMCDQALAAEAIDMRQINRLGLTALSANRGVMTRKHFAKVESWLERSAQLTPDSRDVQMQRAAFYDLSDDYRKSADIYQRLLEDPALKNTGTTEEAKALNNLAYVLADKLNEAEGGLERINRAMSIMGPQSDLLDTRAVIYLRLNEPQHAIDDLVTALSDHTPGKAYIKHMHLAMAYQMADRADDARDSLRKALDDEMKPAELKKGDREAYERLKSILNFDEGEAE